MIRLPLALSACLLLSGCPGGGGGDSNPPPSNPPPAESQPAITDAQRRKRYSDLLFGFFYADFQQMAETKGWTGYVHIAHSDQYGLNLMVEALAQGFTTLILTVGGLGFEQQGDQMVYRGAEVTRANLRDFFDRCQKTSADILPCVGGLYTLDEPNGGPGVPWASDDDLTAFCDDVTVVCAEFDIPVRLWTIYSTANENRPAFGAHHVIGLDNYGAGMRVLGQYQAMELRSDQRRVYVPQACDMDGRGPEDPVPWLNAAVLDPLCVGIMAFYWIGLRKASQEHINAWRMAGQAVVAEH